MSACPLQYLNPKGDLLLAFVVPEAIRLSDSHQQKILDIKGLEGERPAHLSELQRQLNALKNQVKQYLVVLQSLPLAAGYQYSLQGCVKLRRPH